MIEEAKALAAELAEVATEKLRVAVAERKLDLLLPAMITAEAEAVVEPGVIQEAKDLVKQLFAEALQAATDKGELEPLQQAVGLAGVAQVVDASVMELAEAVLKVNEPVLSAMAAARELMISEVHPSRVCAFLVCHVFSPWLFFALSTPHTNTHTHTHSFTHPYTSSSHTATPSQLTPTPTLLCLSLSPRRSSPGVRACPNGRESRSGKPRRHSTLAPPRQTEH